MAAEKQTKVRLSGVAREYNVGQGTIVEFLEKKGFKVEHGPSTILDPKAVELVRNEFGGKSVQKIDIREKIKPVRESVSLHDNAAPDTTAAAGDESVGTETKKKNTGATVFATPVETLSGPKVVGKLDLNGPKKKAAAAEKTATESTATAAVEKPAVKQPEPEPKPVVKTEAVKTPTAPVKPEPKPTQTPTETSAAGTAQSAAPVAKPAVSEEKKEPEVFRANDDANRLAGPKIVGKIELPTTYERGRGGKRNRIKKGKVDVANTPGTSRPATVHGQGANGGGNGGRGGNNGGGRFGGNAAGGGRKGRGGKQPVVRQEVSDEDVQKQIKETLARLTSKGKGSKSAKYRRDKREAIHGRMAEEMEQQEREKSILKVTEFVTVSELATMMDVSVTDVITACMNLGLMVSINQRLDAEALVIVAEEFGYKVEFVTVDIQEAIVEEEDKPEDLLPRPPIVTVMGHVDHGKTSLLDYIRKTNVIEGEAGGITQHIGAYSVKMEDGRRITFLDTPGHEAFTAMRARGAKVTDVAIIIIAADDSVMPQTVEAINHAQAAGVPIVFAINKIDKPNANPEKIKEELANMNYLVEEWGGKYQSQDVAAKKGINVDKLLEKVLLEAELLDLKANPNRRASGTVVESSLDKGRGYVATVLVSAGTLRVGDVMLSGTYSGRVKAMFNERGQKVTEAGPSTPVLVLGLNGAPQAGDNFNVMEDDKAAREIANKREQLQRMQGLRTQKHITLDEIGRRIAVGNFKELNVIIKGDVDGSIEALTDSLVKLSTEEVQVNVIHKAVGPISESDILLAAASNAVIIGFQVRPSASARKLAEKEEIEIRLYSIIYDAINEIKDAIEGMLAPETKEEIVCSVEVMEVFKITKVGTVAGCLVREGKITRNTLVRVIRDGIVVYTGKLGSLKRFKDDVKEVGPNMECGLNIENYNDVKVGDIIEGYEQVEVARKLS
ncbi:translation initiation factor IF-2 [uncultured Rikenella sp.]|uniref:translation initiation factor IF-2 n=1 Tax=uncultured Rikenella sp. TaxID=368003 RepID=UPI0025F4516A|nr:translation initiation factor IF-2 [uncultured Rikenella sp.]